MKIRLLIAGICMVLCVSHTALALDMTNACAGGDVWDNVTDWTPNGTPTAGDDVFIGDTAQSYDHVSLITNGVSGLCSNLTFLRQCKPHINTGGDLHVYGDMICPVVSGRPEIEIQGGQILIDGRFLDNDDAGMVVRLGNNNPATSELIINGAGQSRIESLEIFGPAKFYAPGGIRCNYLQLMSDGAVVSNDVSIGAELVLPWPESTRSCLVTGNVDLEGDTAEIKCFSKGVLTITGAITNGHFNSANHNNFTGKAILTSTGHTFSNVNIYYMTYCINGNFGDAASTITLSSSSTLCSSGMGDKNLAVGSGCTVNPGSNVNVIGTMNLTAGTHNFNAGSILEIEIDGDGTGTNDLLVSGGTVNLNASSEITFDQIGTLPDDSAYTFVEYTSLSGVFGVTNSLPMGYAIDYNYGGSNLIALVKQPGVIIIANTSPSNDTPTNVWFNGLLGDAGGSDATVTLYWGDDDAGTVATNWDTNITIAVVTTDSVPAILTSFVTNLTPYNGYYYRYYATNATTNAWASPTYSYVYANVVTQKYNSATFGTFGSATNWSPQVKPTSSHDVELGDNVEGHVSHNLMADYFTGTCHNATIKANNSAVITALAWGLTVGGMWTNDTYTDYNLNNWSKLTVLGNYYDVGKMYLQSSSETWLMGPDRSNMGELRTYAGSSLEAPAGLLLTGLTRIYGLTCPVTNDIYLLNDIVYNENAGGLETCDLKANIDLMAGTRRLSVYKGHGLTCSGDISNGSLFGHDDANYYGDLYLSGNNSWVDFTVNYGSVFLNGVNPVAGTITVTSAYKATFGGSGTIDKDVTVQSGCTFNAGADHDTVGTYSAPGEDVTIASGATNQVELDGTGAGSCDQVICSNLTVTGSTLDFDVVGSTLDDSAYVIATYSNLVGVFSATNNLPLGFMMTYTYGAGGNQIAITNSVGPEDVVVVNNAPTNVTYNSAFANGQLTATGSSQCAVFLYWGDNDGVTNPTSWDHVVPLGVVTGSVPPASDLTSHMNNLLFGRTYYYRFYATNLTKAIWANPAYSFQSGGMVGKVLDGDYKLLDEDSDIDTEGTFLYAVNGGGLTGDVYTVGGLDIVGDMEHAGDLPPSGGPGGFQSTADGRSVRGLPTGTDLSQELKQILNTTARNNDLYINMNVVQGAAYKMQILFGAANNDDHEMDVYVEDQLVLDDCNIKDDIALLGSSLTQHGMMYTYRYTATDMVTEVYMQVGTSGNPVYNGITLESYDPSLPDIEAMSPTNVTLSNAWLNGKLSSTGSSATAVFVAYGGADEGSDRDAWDVEVPLGTAGADMPEFFTAEATGLIGGRSYYYRYFATNSSGISWSSPRRFNFFTNVYSGTLSLLDEDTDLDLFGNIIYAINEGDRDNHSPLVVGGQTFVGYECSGVTWSNFPTGYYNTWDYSQDGIDPTSAGLSAALKDVLGSFVQGDFCYSEMDVLPGTNYKLQVFFRDVAAWGDRVFNIVVDGIMCVENLSTDDVIAVFDTDYITNAIFFSYSFQPTGSVVRVNFPLTPYLCGMTLEELGDITVPEIENDPATAVTATNAQLNGAVLSEGESSAEIRVYWGDNDAEEGPWDFSYSLGAVTGILPQAVSHVVTGLTGGVTYYYRFYATNSHGEAWAAPSVGFNNNSLVLNGSLEILDAFSDIDLDGDIVYAINCGQSYYNGAPTGTNPPFDGVWGSVLQANRELDVNGVTFKGDLWNHDTSARNVNFAANFDDGGNPNEYYYAPQRFPPNAKEEGFTLETGGSYLGQPGQNPTNSCPYQWAVGDEALAANMFAPGTDEDNMEKIIGRHGKLDCGTFYFPESEREISYSFDVTHGGKYKIQMIFYLPNDQSDTRIEVDGVMCIDGLDATAYPSNPTNEATLWSYEFVANSSTTVVGIGRSSLNAPKSEDGKSPWINGVSAITLERIAPVYTIISIW